MKRMSKSTHSRKKKSAKGVVRNIIMLLFVFYLLFIAFYSHGVTSADDLEVHAVEIIDIEFHHRGRYGKHWLSFLTSDGEEFYCRIEGPNRSTISELKKAALPVSAKVSYGKPDLLLANIIIYDNRLRLATLEVDGNRIIDLEHYNAVNSEYRVGFIIVAAICLLVATFPYWLVWLLQKISARKE